MKKNKGKIASFSFLGFILFFTTIICTSTASIIVYYFTNKASGGNFWAITFAVLGIIIVGAIICCIVDIIRRRKMIDNPTELILEATDKIASGDFDVNLTPLHEYNKFNHYDIIFENLNKMAKELAKNEVLKNDFISNVSHEIKTPLAVIQNYAKMLRNKNLTDSQKQSCLEGLELQTKRLSTLVSNILKLNKLENQQLSNEMIEFDLSELLRETTLQFENLLEKKNLELYCDIDEIKITNSPSLLEIVFNNLISNAIKFTDVGGGIFISLKDENNTAVVKVADNGCGISSETGKHIFDKFYQGDTSHAGEGNGLGLALVKKVIDIIGGEISVESKIGKGSTFIIKLKK